jgi:hypothetical protein
MDLRNSVLASPQVFQVCKRRAEQAPYAHRAGKYDLVPLG